MLNKLKNFWKLEFRYFYMLLLLLLLLLFILLLLRNHTKCCYKSKARLRYQNSRKINLILRKC